MPNIDIALTQDCHFTDVDLTDKKNWKHFYCRDGKIVDERGKDTGKKCPRCKDGREPTEFGQELLDFIREFGT
jgi:hypothetical protein